MAHDLGIHNFSDLHTMALDKCHIILTSSISTLALRTSMLSYRLDILTSFISTSESVSMSISSPYIGGFYPLACHSMTNAAAMEPHEHVPIHEPIKVSCIRVAITDERKPTRSLQATSHPSILFSWRTKEWVWWWWRNDNCGRHVCGPP